MRAKKCLVDFIELTIVLFQRIFVFMDIDMISIYLFIYLFFFRSLTVVCLRNIFFL